MGHKARVCSSVALAVSLVATSLIATNTTSWASGVSVASDATAITTTTTDGPQQFDTGLSNALESLQNSGDTNNQSIQSFYSAYLSAQTDYQTAVSGATALYNSTFMNDPTSAAQTLVTNLNSARDTFVGAVTTAKDRLLSELNGGAMSSAGTAFSNNYSIAISQYVSTVNGVTTQMEEVSQ